ncbi:MAG: ATP-binding cassette domain-containing protein [Peptococcaceae bacterium]|jgi:energy-coupling factor transport system ATP-binding protein|nr:ATP-binding cassette domain-containing protein [Peptococcaceae bacterium]
MISLKQVTFSYEKHEPEAVRDIDIAVKDGECVLLCGRSGCGKTTVIRLINGLIPNFYPGDLRGSVIVNGKTVSDTPMFELAEQIGSVFQNPRTQFFNVDTDSEIAFGIENEALPYNELRRRLRQTTIDLGIQALRGRNIFELSGGEKQKIAFASVYAMNPDIYLLDEPSSNLDTRSIQELRRHLALTKEQGKTIIIAEHRIYYLMELADRVIYFDNGRVAGEYTPSELKRLDGSRREAMGLRAADLCQIHPAKLDHPLKQAVLELKNVALRRNKKVILDGVNLKLAHGEIVGVVGRNGVGKSTFSRSLCGLHKDVTGTFLWNGAEAGSKKRLELS